VKGHDSSAVGPVDGKAALSWYVVHYYDHCLRSTLRLLRAACFDCATVHIPSV
jgi:hypothetical protein